MLVRPSVTPKDRTDYLAAYSKRHDLDDSLLNDPTKTSVRFNPEARQIPQGTDYHSGEGEGKEDGRIDYGEDFPLRQKPVKGRKQTGLPPAKRVAKSDDFPSVAQIAKQHAGVSLDLGASHEKSIEPASKPHKGPNPGMASKIAGAMWKSKTRRAPDSSSHDEDISINVNTLSIQDSEQSEGVTKSSKKSIPHAMYTPEAFAPVFAEGISLFQPKATYNSKDKSEVQKNMKSLPMSKHAFARIVDSARRHKSPNKKDNDNSGQVEAEAVIEIAPGPRAKLLELAKAAKMKAQQKPNGVEYGVEGRDNEPGWNCAGMDPSTLLQEARPLPSLTIQPATPQLSSLSREREHRKAQDRALKKSASRSRLVEQARSDQPEDIIWIGKDGQETTSGVEERQHRHHGHGHRHRSERSRSRHRTHQDSSHGTHYSPQEGDAHRENDEREHRRVHRSRHPEQHRVHRSSSRHDMHHSSSRHDTRQDMHHSNSTEQLPDKRKGKVLESGAETQRLNLALTMARTRMEMEIAEQQEAKQQGAKIERAVKDDEEKAWLEEAYEEAVKKEVEYQYLYEAHSLGGTW